MKLCIVIPCYNEEAVLKETAAAVKGVLESLIVEGEISNNSKIAFIDDGSKDKTWEIIKELSANDEVFEGIKLSRNPSWLRLQDRYHR